MRGIHSSSYPRADLEQGGWATGGGVPLCRRRRRWSGLGGAWVAEGVWCKEEMVCGSVLGVHRELALVTGGGGLEHWADGRWAIQSAVLGGGR